jgi:hypothetical protein
VRQENGQGGGWFQLGLDDTARARGDATMAELINLNRARKTKARAAGQAKAEANRAKFGMTKAEKARIKADAERAARVLDQSKRET